MRDEHRVFLPQREYTDEMPVSPSRPRQNDLEPRARNALELRRHAEEPHLVPQRLHQAVT